MGINAIIKRVAREQEAGRPLTREQIARGMQTTIPFAFNNGLSTDSDNNYLLWIDQVSSSGIKIALSGLEISNGDLATLPDPFRLDWYLYASGDCIIDSEPCWEGSTWFKGGLSIKNGMLVQCSGLEAQAWFLKLVVQDMDAQQVGAVGITLKGALEYALLDPSVATDGPRLAIGPWVG
jgi:hypothetical protein